MRLTLKRFADWGAGGTVGRLSTGTGKWECWSLEAPWRDNQRNISCVPTGLYELVRHNGLKYQQTWALKNHDLGVGVDPTVQLQRYWCCFHRANWAHQLEGCIAFGMSLALDRGMPSIRSSGAALAHITGLMDWEDGQELLIERCFGGWET